MLLVLLLVTNYTHLYNFTKTRPDPRARVQEQRRAEENDSINLAVYSGDTRHQGGGQVIDDFADVLMPEPEQRKPLSLEIEQDEKVLNSGSKMKLQRRNKTNTGGVSGDKYKENSSEDEENRKQENKDGSLNFE